MSLKIKHNHIRFLEHYIAHGMTNAAASYKAIYPNASDGTAVTNASRLLRMAHVKEHLTLMLKEASENAPISKEELIRDLQFIKDNQKLNNPQASLKAIEILTKMLGYNAPVESETTFTIKGEQPLFLPLDSEIRPKEIEGGEDDEFKLIEG